ncbi:hypothetical protein [Nitratireductor thuwali]|uniref:Uncharacterized protein n=1 Tax=Nitratireductor thuwali TaxID=2267699 RepID=A0ABY5MDQ3_9HYPH|nr:hypothetical protein NTH_00628 [Nitratireductor thuwali]
MYGIQTDRQRRLALIARISEATFRIRAAHLELLLERRANFDPNQPRVPRGHRHGGRWTRTGGWREPAQRTDSGRPRIILASHEPEEPEVPERRPETARERNRIGRSVARYLKQLPSFRQALFLARVGWLANEAGHTIRSYFDEPRSLEELRERAKESRSGYDVHHIVEKTPAYQAGYTRGMIESADNKILIPRYKHWEITAWYGTRSDKFGGLTPREYLRGRSWEERYRIGIEMLVEKGVLKQ